MSVVCTEIKRLCKRTHRHSLVSYIEHYKFRELFHNNSLYVKSFSKTQSDKCKKLLNLKHQSGDSANEGAWKTHRIDQ